MSDHISVMREGRIAQSGTPRELYDAPASRYVADFVGETNFFAGEVAAADAQGATVQLASGPALSAPYSRSAAPLHRGGRAVIALRPELIELRPAAAGLGIDPGVSFSGRVHNRIYLGDQTEFRVTTDELGEVLVRAGKTSQAVAAGVGPGDPVVLGWGQDAGLALSDD